MVCKCRCQSSTTAFDRLTVPYCVMTQLYDRVDGESRTMRPWRGLDLGLHDHRHAASSEFRFGGDRAMSGGLLSLIKTLKNAEPLFFVCELAPAEAKSLAAAVDEELPHQPGVFIVKNFDRAQQVVPFGLVFSLLLFLIPSCRVCGPLQRLLLLGTVFVTPGMKLANLRGKIEALHQQALPAATPLLGEWVLLEVNWAVDVIALFCMLTSLLAPDRKWTLTKVAQGQ